MDPLTQGLVGATLAASCANREEIRPAIAAGWAGGMLADIDTFFRSGSDSLFNVLIHRHFTHALIFIPIGGLISALLIHFFLKKQISFSKTLFFSMLGYATHGLLDACTSYGTHLLWPFYENRVAWDNIAIIDPLLSGTMFFALVYALWKKVPSAARIGLFFGIFYLFLGVMARDYARAEYIRIAESRGHTISRMRVMPTIGNIILWRGVYESGDKIYIDGFRIGLFSRDRFYQGTSLPKFRLKKNGETRTESRLERDIERFLFFSDGYVSKISNNPEVLGDIRYSVLPNGADPLWGIVFHKAKPDSHAAFFHFNNRNWDVVSLFFRMLFGSI